MPLVYDELRRLAASYLRRERPGQTLQATALVHEAYVRLIGEKAHNWQNRTHFLAIAALSMRQILVQRARAPQSGQARRRSRAHHARRTVARRSSAGATDEVDLVALDAALERLAALDERAGQDRRAALLRRAERRGSAPRRWASRRRRSSATGRSRAPGSNGARVRSAVEPCPSRSPLALMTDRDDRIDRLYALALEQPASGRDAFIDSAAEADDIKADVRAVLERRGVRRRFPVRHRGRNRRRSRRSRPARCLGSTASIG